MISWARTWLTTKINEDGIHQMKTKSNANDKGTMGRAYRYASLIQGTLLSEYGYDPVEVNSADRANSIGQRFDHTTEDEFSCDFDENSVIERPCGHYTLDLICSRRLFKISIVATQLSDGVNIILAV